MLVYRKSVTPFMNTSRRQLLKLLALLPVSVGVAAEANPELNPAKKFLGSWLTTSAATSLVLSIEPGGQGLSLMIENGSFNINRIKWEPLGSGIIIQGFPRFRFWEGKSDDDARVEMEEIPAEAEVSRSVRQFPLSFFMRRVKHHPGPTGLLGRPIPEAWRSVSLDPDWDKKAGRRRTAAQ
jgi:hypothetical protein